MEKYTPTDYHALRTGGDIQQRLDFAKSIGNYRVDPNLLRQTIVRSARAYLVQQGLSEAEIEHLAPAPPPAWRGMPTTGTVRVFALLIEFSDELHTNDASIINAALFGTPTTGVPYESLAAYYRRSSYGKLDLSEGTALGWYKASKKRSDIAQTDAGREGLIKEALKHFNDSGHDFRQYDNNGDGVIDYFLVFWTGPDNGWANFWWGYQTTFSDSSFKLDGVSLGKYSWQWESRPVGSAFNPQVSIHETGHALGLPDLYDYDGSVGPDGGVGGLDMMDANQGDHNSFSKWMLEWLMPSIVSSGKQTLTLRPTATTEDAIVIWPGIASGDVFSEMFMVQNRQRIGNDTTLPNEGLLIWHVDASLDGSGRDFAYDNSFTSHKLVRLMEADGREDIEANRGADAGDFYGTGAQFGPTTKPSSTRYDGKASGVNVRYGSKSGTEVTAVFELQAPAVAAIYEHSNYTGRSQTLDVGRYDIGQLTIGNDVISSVKVPWGWKVTLYEHAHFQGDTRVITADTPALAGFNDKTSSIVVRGSDPAVVIYEHNNYAGRGQVLDVGRYDIGQLTIGNDVISSVKVPPGWKVTLYEHAHFKGTARVITADTSALSGFNDKTSSIVVER